MCMRSRSPATSRTGWCRITCAPVSSARICMTRRSTAPVANWLATTAHWLIPLGAASRRMMLWRRRRSGCSRPKPSAAAWPFTCVDRRSFRRLPSDCCSCLSAAGNPATAAPRMGLGPQSLACTPQGVPVLFTFCTHEFDCSATRSQRLRKRRTALAGTADAVGKDRVLGVSRADVIDNCSARVVSLRSGKEFSDDKSS